MRRQDFIFILFILVLFAPFFMFPALMDEFEHYTRVYPVMMSFIKFALLATTGELLGLRIKTGSYIKRGFGILPRSLVWGILGVSIYIAFVVFPSGTMVLAQRTGIIAGIETPAERFILAFMTSVLLNLIFAPVMMTTHKISDTHILQTGGKLGSFFTRVRVVSILENLDWKTHWQFIMCRTIPLFWIPAHTVTFLLPAAYRVLFAALLGIMLGVILAVANKGTAAKA
ncbi:MAG TPA: hypothetical protein P5531_04580 [Bacteroidales bacterium]|nr:hypothetical protein [Bacteroidales bacterium]HSA42721.1 hypothetical protein [Bacteroidales bacterium]